MTTKTEQYASQFAAVNERFIATLEGGTDEQWRRACAGEGWSIAVVAHHVAETNQAFAKIIGKLADGETYSPDISMERIHEYNAQHARDYAEVGKQETIDLLRESGDGIVQQLRRLDDERLGGTAGIFGGNAMTVAQVVEMVVIGHTGEHLESIRATLAG